MPYASHTSKVQLGGTHSSEEDGLLEERAARRSLQVPAVHARNILQKYWLRLFCFVLFFYVCKKFVSNEMLNV